MANTVARHDAATGTTHRVIAVERTVPPAPAKAVVPGPPEGEGSGRSGLCGHGWTAPTMDNSKRSQRVPAGPGPGTHSRRISTSRDAALSYGTVAGGVAPRVRPSANNFAMT